MNGYKIISLCAATLIVITGCVYLLWGTPATWPTLLICALCLGVMGGAKTASLRKEKVTDLAHYIPAICLLILSLGVFVALVLWFIK